MRDTLCLTLLFVVLTLLSSCRTEPVREARPSDYYSRPLPRGEMALEKLQPHDYPDFSLGFRDRESLLSAIDESLAYYGKASSRSYFPYLGISHRQAVQSLEAFRDLIATSITGRRLNDKIREQFDVYASKGCDGRGTVLFTGYYEPIVAGSLTPSETYRFPLYRLPPDLVKNEAGKALGRRTAGGIVPYYTRKQIDREKRLAGEGLEMVWLKDRFEAFLVHVQGSARIRLPDGKEMRIGYAGKTDQPYASVGQAMIRDGLINGDSLSIFTMKDYFSKHPKALDRYLNLNKSYVFFTEREGGPYGSLNAAVTPMRTIATDKSVFPRGALGFVATSLPTPEGGAARPFRGFVLDQDTGGAIRSAGRCDLFIGSGPEALKIAGRTHSEGKLFYLFLKSRFLSAQRANT